MTVESIPPSSEEIPFAPIEADSANYHLNQLRDADYRRNMFWRWLFSIRHFIARLLGVGSLETVIGGVLSALSAFAIVLVVGVILGMRRPFCLSSRNHCLCGFRRQVRDCASTIRFGGIQRRLQQALDLASRSPTSDSVRTKGLGSQIRSTSHFEGKRVREKTEQEAGGGKSSPKLGPTPPPNFASPGVGFISLKCLSCGGALGIGTDEQALQDTHRLDAAASNLSTLNVAIWNELFDFVDVLPSA